MLGRYIYIYINTGKILWIYRIGKFHTAVCNPGSYPGGENRY